MDDFAQDVLTSSRDEYIARLITYMERCLMPWLDEVFAETSRICLENRQPQQYLLAMQAAMAEVPHWNAVALEKETARVLQACPYMAELLSCAMVTQIKLLTCGRTTDRRKNIRVPPPALATFVHRVYLNVARQVHIYPFLFEQLQDDLQRTRQRAERERVVRGCVMDTVRNGLGVPTEEILRAYLDESVENEEQVFIEPVAPAERDEIQELENAKRRALGLEPVGGAADGAAAETPVDAMRRPPSAAEEERAAEEQRQQEMFAGGASVGNVDERPVVTRVEFSPHDRIHPIPARGDADYYDDGGGSDAEYRPRDRAAPVVTMDLNNNVESIDGLW